MSTVAYKPDEKLAKRINTGYSVRFKTEPALETHLSYRLQVAQDPQNEMNVDLLKVSLSAGTELCEDRAQKQAEREVADIQRSVGLSAGR